MKERGRGRERKRERREGGEREEGGGEREEGGGRESKRERITPRAAHGLVVSIFTAHCSNIEARKTPYFNNHTHLCT